MKGREGKIVETSISHLNVCFPAPMLEEGPAHMFRIKPVPVRKPQQREKANNIFYTILLQQKLLQFFSVRGFLFLTKCIFQTSIE